MSVQLRPATAADQAAIKALIKLVRINPTGLDWRRFTIADDDGRFVGCVQVKPHSDGVRELASLAVIPERHGQGLGGQLIRSVLERESGDLYLSCRSRLSTYYARFGFCEVAPADLPSSFKPAYRFGRLLVRLGRFEGLSIMLRPGQG